MFREIIVKTMIGKGKYNGLETQKITLPKAASKTLGCWIINHQFDTEESKRNVVIKGQFDVQLWYATDHDQKTNVYNETIPFFGQCQMSWRKLKTVGNETWIHVHVVKYPTAISMSLVDEKTVEIQIESAYIIDAFSDAIVTIDCKEDDVDDSDLDEEIIMNVNPHYLEEKK